MLAKFFFRKIKRTKERLRKEREGERGKGREAREKKRVKEGKTERVRKKAE